MYSSWVDTTPQTTFPLGRHSTTTFLLEETIDEQLVTLLINSDPSECNENLTTYLKLIVDNVYTDETGDRSYHTISKYALKLLTLNLFIKNYQFCVGKILAFLTAFNSMTDLTQDKVALEAECFKEFLCIILLLLLKVKNTDRADNHCEELNAIDTNGLFETFREYNFVHHISTFITNHVLSTNQGKSPFILLKFGCDVFFEYLYHIELLNDSEFHSLTKESTLIPTLIAFLLSNDNYDNYDINGDDFEDEDKLIAYEEFKLLLLINEQYLMKCYSSLDMKNEVFEGLMRVREDKQVNHANIAGFLNLLIYHLNREESQIIKILILKFLYLVFTTSYTVSLIYLNDLKILVDIFMRELNNLDYTTNNDNRVLLMAYLRVTYPLLMFSQLKELHYKWSDIVDVLGNIVLHSSEESQLGMKKLALKCMSIDWIKQRRRNTPGTVDKALDMEKPPTEITEIELPKDSFKKLTIDDSAIELYSKDLNTSSESLGSFARIASVRTSTRKDFYKHTTAQNKSKQSLFIENNNNIFMQNLRGDSSPTPSEKNILDLPAEYLNSKPLPQLPRESRVYKEPSPTSSVSLLVIKALKKKAPPPPPHHLHLTRTPSPMVSNTHSPSNSHLHNLPIQLHNQLNNLPNLLFNNLHDPSTPPPPPPPRRRR